MSRTGFLSPAVRRLLAEHGLEASEVDGTGAGGRITRRDVEEVLRMRGVELAPEPFPPDEVDRVEAPPPDAADRIDAPAPDGPAPAEVESVEAAEPAEPARSPESVEPAAAVDEPSEETVATDATEPTPVPAEWPAERDWQEEVDWEGSADTPSSRTSPRQTLVPFTPIRRRIAENLKASRATAAHAFCAVETDFHRVEQVRHAHRDKWREQEGFALTYLPFVARAVVTALAEYPHLNASVIDDALLVHHDVHLGIAVDLQFEGLIVPVIRNASSRNLRDLARGVSDLAERARSGSLRPDDVSSGTFTITNPGPSGTLLSVPIINQPQVGILATDTVRRRPVMLPTADGGEGLAVHPMGLLGLSFDHRAVDGLYATSFLSRVKDVLEVSDWEHELSVGTSA